MSETSRSTVEWLTRRGWSRTTQPRSWGGIGRIASGAGLSYAMPMKCPACKSELREKGAGGMTVDICYGGCGGIWFDQRELERVDGRAAANLHTVWRYPTKEIKLTEPRVCPRCPNQVLDRRWFSKQKLVEVDQCPTCGGLWLDEGEFSRIHQEMKGAKMAPPGWAAAIAQAAAQVRA